MQSRQTSNSYPSCLGLLRSWDYVAGTIGMYHHVQFRVTILDRWSVLITLFTMGGISSPSLSHLSVLHFLTLGWINREFNQTTIGTHGVLQSTESSWWIVTEWGLCGFVGWDFNFLLPLRGFGGRAVPWGLQGGDARTCSEYLNQCLLRPCITWQKYLHVTYANSPAYFKSPLDRNTWHNANAHQHSLYCII